MDHEHEHDRTDPEDKEEVAGGRDAQAAAKSEGKPKGPQQDETASTTWDTDQHSDAPGPTGTG